MMYKVTVFGKHDVVYGKTTVEADTEMEAWKKAEEWWGCDDYDSIAIKPIE